MRCAVFEGAKIRQKNKQPRQVVTLAGVVCFSKTIPRQVWIPRQPMKRQIDNHRDAIIFLPIFLD